MEAPGKRRGDDPKTGGGGMNPQTKKDWGGKRSLNPVSYPRRKEFQTKTLALQVP